MTATIPMWTRSTDIRNLALGQSCEGQWLLSHLYKESLPDALWFILGTAVHEGIEYAILEDADLDSALETAHLSAEWALHNDNGVLESSSKRSKRNLGTLADDINRLVAAWFTQVHPDSEKRLPQYNEYDWPPRVEHQIRLPGHRLYTTVDAIFTGGPDNAPVAIVDWKSGVKASTQEAQLQVYQFGGLLEGWAKDTERIGWFHHIEAGKLQYVYDYWGDETVGAWLDRTYDAKRHNVTGSKPIFNPDWWCKSCRAKEECPVQGEGTFLNIRKLVDKAELEDVPKEDPNG